MLQWQKEYGNVNDLPSARSTLLLFAVLAVLLLTLVGGTNHELAAEQDQPQTICQQHQGRPGWMAVCADRP